MLKLLVGLVGANAIANNIGDKVVECLKIYEDSKSQNTRIQNETALEITQIQAAKTVAVEKTKAMVQFAKTGVYRNLISNQKPYDDYGYDIDYDRDRDYDYDYDFDYSNGYPRICTKQALSETSSSYSKGYYCKRCGKSQDADAIFCKWCGTRL